MTPEEPTPSEGRLLRILRELPREEQALIYRLVYASEDRPTMYWMAMGDVSGVLGDGL
jgi:hypothetical protein